MKQDQLMNTLNLLSHARNKLGLKEYIEIWGEQLGNHIWRQEGTDLLKIWRSGLTRPQGESLAKYLIEKFAR